jgi:hypothetical protein
MPRELPKKWLIKTVINPNEYLKGDY